MNADIKQIYACLELGESNLKLLIAEYFNTRFNVIKVECATTEAISDFKVLDSEQLSKDIKALIDNTSNKLGAKIEQVILVLPAYNFKRYPLKSSVVPDNGYLVKKDIARAITNSLKVKVDDDVLVVNPMVVKYNANGLSTRRLPEKEVCEQCVVDIDLLCGDKSMAMDYVTCVEKAGVKVLDITLNTYAIGKEAALFEESLKQNLICLNITRTCTYLSLLSKGKLVSSEIVFDGINNIVDALKLKYDVNVEDLIKLIKFDVDANDENVNDIVYAFNTSGKTCSITKDDINEICLPIINNYVDKLMVMCKPILEKGASIFITGEGQQINCLVEKIKELGNCDVKSYYPDTIGVRDPSLTAVYGGLFVYKEKALLYDLNVNCIDLLQYDSIIDNKEFDSEGETITTKIKNLFKQYVENNKENE